MKPHLEVVDISVLVVVLLNDLLQSLQVSSNAETSFEEMDVSAPFSWGGYGMIIGEDGATKSVHLILKCPV